MMRRAVVLMAVLAFAAPVMAATPDHWDEQGDAPELLPGQVVEGEGPLAEIFGSFSAGNDVDLYLILVKDEGFSASTVDRCDCDTQLFLFDADGLAVVHNDDNEVPGNGFTSLITDQFIPGAGIYYLAVTQYNNDPLSPDDDLIWNNTPFREERQPDGPGAPGPLNSWAYNFGGTFDYSIGLTGANFVPEPSTLALLGLGGFALLRRRK